MTLSVVIPVLNEEVVLPRTLDHLSKINGLDEIIVVDGNSEDRTAEIAEQRGIQLLQTDPGRGIQLEDGWRKTTGDIICFLHVDTLLPKNAPMLIRETFHNPEVALTAFSLSFETTHPGIRIAAFGANLRSRFLRLPYGDQALSVRRSYLEKIGGLPLWPYLEDVYLVEAMREYGKMKMLPGTVRTSPRRYEQNGLIKTIWQHKRIMKYWRQHHSPMETTGR